MRDVKCSYCEEYRNEWCEKVTDSPHPDILRDCQYFHEAKTRWIPVTERLPEDNTRVLVTFADGIVGTSSWHSGTDYNNGFDNFMLGITEIGIERRGVVAWMPLPEPYKEGQDDVG